MSYANFGPTYPSKVVVNALAARIPIPVSLAGDGLVNVNLIQTAAGVEIPLVLAPGVYHLRSRAFFEPLAAGAMGIQYAQGYLINLTSNDIIATSSSISGAAYAAGQDNVQVVITCDVMVSIANETSFAFRFRSNGITTQAGRMGAIGGASNSQLRATKLDA